MIRIIGMIRLATTGWSVVEFDNDSKPHVLDYGCIITKKGLTVSERLCEIYQDVLELVRNKPSMLVWKHFFCNQKQRYR